MLTHLSTCPVIHTAAVKQNPSFMFSCVFCDLCVYACTLSVCQNPNAHPRPISQDLAGFWDMLQLSIENISLKFDELHQLKANNWKPLTPPEIQVRMSAAPIGLIPNPFQMITLI